MDADFENAFRGVRLALEKLDGMVQDLAHRLDQIERTVDGLGHHIDLKTAETIQEIHSRT